jgi:hypothetical protein
VTRQQSLEPRDAPFLERCGQRSFDRRFIHAVYTLIIGISAHPILLRYAVHERIRPLSWTSVSPAPGPACGFSATPSLLAQLTLDGTFTDRELSPAARLAQIAEQTVRDILVDRPDIRLTDVNVLQMPVGPVVVVSIQSAREPIPPRIGRAEKTIPERTGDPNVVLLVRTVVSSDITSTGRVLLGQAHFGVSSEQDAVMARTLEESTRKQIRALHNIIPNSVDAAPSGEGWEVRAEVVGATVPSPDDIAAIEQTLTREIGAPVTLSVLARAEVVVTGTRYESVQERVEAEIRRRQEAAAGTAAPAQPAGSLPQSP